MNQRGWVVVFGKPPLPGQVKTRLAATIGEQSAACVAQAMLADTWDKVGSLPARRALSTPDPAHDHGLPEATVWDQGSGDLGARIERMVRRSLDDGPWGLAIGADAPHVPVALLQAAIDALRDHDAVLGPSRDGGFWCLGLKQCPMGLLAELPWSADTTFTATAARLRQRGLSLAIVPSWWDVDFAPDLEELVRHGDAPRTVEAARACWG